MTRGRRPARFGGPGAAGSPSPSADTAPHHAPTASRCCGCAGIGKRFGPVQALTDIDLDVPAGQVTALVGDNGAGKTTLVKSIAGIWEPSSRRDPLERQAGPPAQPA